MRGSKPLEYVCKPLTMVAITAFALVIETGVHGSQARPWFVAAFVVSLAGDVFLMLPSDRFVPGLASFLLAHLAFIAGFTATGLDRSSLLVGGAVAVVLLGTVGRRVAAGARREEAALVAPVVVYMLAISAMVATAAGAGIGGTAAQGAALFYVSDAFIGWSRFVDGRRWHPITIIVTYHLAQLSLATALLAS